MEYTTDPEAIAHYLAARSRTANWVDSLTGKTLMGIGSEIEAAEASLQSIISHQYHYQTPTYTPQHPECISTPCPGPALIITVLLGRVLCFRFEKLMG
ncbi:hypothetical protein BGY98DRAFT_324313 [Russula aff. rugulosa BPL654]|nr:hypothetical protein BGY98DRAFT_324313 [Russula aff. rugulosa BPL654]